VLRTGAQKKGGSKERWKNDERKSNTFDGVDGTLEMNLLFLSLALPPPPRLLPLAGTQTGGIDT
tara:strand:+ start:413 stop:604 length:192 start_codon:yes stop_codon:yes gene_type:complete